MERLGHAQWCIFRLFLTFLNQFSFSYWVMGGKQVNHTEWVNLMVHNDEVRKIIKRTRGLVARICTYLPQTWVWCARCCPVNWPSAAVQTVVRHWWRVPQHYDPLFPHAEAKLHCAVWQWRCCAAPAVCHRPVHHAVWGSQRWPQHPVPPQDHADLIEVLSAWPLQPDPLKQEVRFLKNCAKHHSWKNRNLTFRDQDGTSHTAKNWQ